MKSIFFSTITLLIFSAAEVYCQWQNKSNGLPVWTTGYSIDAVGENICVISVSMNSTGKTIYLTTDKGYSWDSSFSTDPFFSINAVDIEIVDDNKIWAALGDGKIIATTNAGLTWHIQFDDTMKTQFMNYIEMFDQINGIAMGDCLLYPNNQPDPNSPALILTTTDGGNSWFQNNNQQLLGLSSGDLWRRIDFINPDIGFFYSSGEQQQKIYFTSTAGTFWEVLYPGLYTQILKFYDPNFGLLYDGEKIFRTVDGGINWSYAEIEAAGWGNDIEFIPGNPSNVFFTDNQKLFYSADSGKSWIVNSDIAGGRDVVFTDSKHGWVLGDNGKLFYTENAGGTFVDVKNENIINSEFSLLQNYPNPFNPETIIGYVLPAGGYVSLKVFDVLGSEIYTLADEYQTGGFHKKTFNAGLASGIYFYTLRFGSFQQTKKFVIAK